MPPAAATAAMTRRRYAARGSAAGFAMFRDCRRFRRAFSHAFAEPLLSPPIRLPPLPADGAPLLPPRQQQIIEAAEGYRRSHQINRYGAFSAIASPNSFHFQPIFHCRIQLYAFLSDIFMQFQARLSSAFAISL
jgi:hypothetical protein